MKQKLIAQILKAKAKCGKKPKCCAVHSAN